ncbi:hypothetical protein KY319_04740 [Candidatus Woesearchaeota archaeon]|nr:hypothetical protein [Candidatus Woesearchaeota archaeon]
MKTTKLLSITSLLLIAAMLLAPAITAQVPGGIATGVGTTQGGVATGLGSTFGGIASGIGAFFGGLASSLGALNGGTAEIIDEATDSTTPTYEPPQETPPTTTPTDTTPGTTMPPPPIPPPTIPVPPGGFPTNADAVWEDLPDVTISKASPSGTIIQRDVFSKCSDPDDDYLEFNIATTSDHYELAFVNSDLRIFKLNPYYVGSEIITLTCNRVPESFFLHVVQTGTPTQPETDSDEDGLSVHINTIRLPDSAIAGEQIPITITFKNNGHEKLENVKATVIIQDLAIRASAGPMDLTRGKKISKTVYVELPEDVQPGTYYAKIMIDSNSLHRVKHRELIIE